MTSTTVAAEARRTPATVGIAFCLGVLEHDGTRYTCTRTDHHIGHCCDEPAAFAWADRHHLHKCKTGSHQDEKDFAYRLIKDGITEPNTLMWQPLLPGYTINGWDLREHYYLLLAIARGADPELILDSCKALDGWRARHFPRKRNPGKS